MLHISMCMIINHKPAYIICWAEFNNALNVPSSVSLVNHLTDVKLNTSVIKANMLCQKFLFKQIF